MCINACAKEFEKMIDEHNQAIAEKVRELGEKLGRYGFKGNLTCSVIASLKDEYGRDMKVARENSFIFSKR